MAIRGELQSLAHKPHNKCKPVDSLDRPSDHAAKRSVSTSPSCFRDISIVSRQASRTYSVASNLLGANHSGSFAQAITFFRRRRRQRLRLLRSLSRDDARKPRSRQRARPSRTPERRYCGTDESWLGKINSRYATLMWLANPQAWGCIQPYRELPRWTPGRAWFVME